MTAMSYILTAVGGLIAGGTGAYRYVRGDLDVADSDLAEQARRLKEAHLAQNAAQADADRVRADLRIAERKTSETEDWLEAARADNGRLLDGISKLSARWELEGTTDSLKAAAELRPLLAPAKEEKALAEALTAEADSAEIHGGPLLDRIADLIEGRPA